MSLRGTCCSAQPVNGDTHVLVADLGVAKSMLDAVGATMTAGTPSYMAPEQAMGVAPLDRRADIYSLTAVTYAMLTGHPPFPVRSIADILARDPSRTPEPIAERLGAPSTLDGVMLSGLAADRNRRPPSALLLADGLQTIADQMEAAGTSRQIRRRQRDHAPVAPDRVADGQRDHRVRATTGHSTGSVILPAALSSNVGIRASWSLPRPGRPAGLPALTAAGHSELSQFRQLVWDEPVDYAAAGSPHSVQAGVLLRPAGRLGARSLRHLDVRHHPGAPLRTPALLG